MAERAKAIQSGLFEQVFPNRVYRPPVLQAAAQAKEAMKNGNKSEARERLTMAGALMNPEEHAQVAKDVTDFVNGKATPEMIKILTDELMGLPE